MWRGYKKHFFSVPLEGQEFGIIHFSHMIKKSSQKHFPYLPTQIKAKIVN